MKKIILLLVCFAFFQSKAQKKTDYEIVIGKFMKFYNAGQADSICNMFSDSWGKSKATLWKQEDLKELKEKYGEMKSYKYMQMENKSDIALFKCIFEKTSNFCMGVSLDKKNKMKTHRFKTESDYINDLLKKY